MTRWRLGLVVWTLAVIVIVASQGYGIVPILFVWLIGLAILGGVRAAVQR